MRTTLFLAVILLCATITWSADTVNLNVKLGLWEVTTTSSISGMPPIPADTLAKLTPEQRARFEASMKASTGGPPRTSTEKTCETKEKLEKQTLFEDKNMECTRTIITSTSTRLESKIHCSHQGQTSDGTMRIDAMTPESAKGAIDMDSSGGGNTMKIKMSFTAHWIGPNCGTVK